MPDNSHGGHFDAFATVVPQGKLISDAKICINSNDFYINGQNYSDIIPVIVRHEGFEPWMYSKKWMVLK